MHVLWDIDGTLIRGGPRAGSLYLDSIEAVTGSRPTVRVPDPHGMTEGQLLTAILELNDLDTGALDDVLVVLDDLSRAEYERGAERERCPGVFEALAAVTARGWTNALLTGNGPRRARHKVLAAGIDADLFDWANSAFGDRSPTRHHLTADARRRLGERAAVIIGDTPKDGEAADTAGFPFIAVATGAFTADELRATSAVAVVDDLASGLDVVVEAIAAAAATQSIGTASARK